MTEPLSLTEFLPIASRTWRECSGADAVLCDPVMLKSGARSQVIRCRVESGRGVSSVIVKSIQGDEARGFSDWASLEFLSRLPKARNIVPRFYGGDVHGRLFLMEDWGASYSLEEILTGSDPTAALQALQDMATQMARLHGATLGKEGDFEAIRAALPGAEKLGRCAEATNWLAQVFKIESWFAAVDCALPAQFETELGEIAQIYQNPEGFLAFTHGDPAPSNNHFGSGRAGLLDFEYGGYRHALYDITAWCILCPLPPDCVREMSRCFRDELSATCPMARDVDRFERDFAALCAYRALAILTWIPLDVLAQNKPWAGNWTMREAVLVALIRLKEVTSPFGKFEAVSHAAGVLSRALLGRWHEFDRSTSLLPQWRAL